MKASDDLFRLVKSLTKSEKRYFKLSASLYGGDKRYLALFDAIDAMDAYDEPALKARFAGEPMVRQFNVAKRYLYDLVLRVLRAVHAGTTVHAEIRAMIQNIEILMDRGLADQARKAYRAAIERAQQHEDHLALLELYAWHESIEPESTMSDEGIEKLYGTITGTIGAYQELMDQLAALRRITVPFLPGPVRSQSEANALHRLMERHPGNGGTFASVKAEILDCWSRSTYHHALGNDAEALRYTERQVTLFEQHPQLLRSRVLWYVGVVANYLMLLKRNGHVQRFWEQIETMRVNVQSVLQAKRLSSPSVQANLFRTVYLNMLTMALGLDDRERFAALAREVEEGLRRHGAHLVPDERLSFWHNLSLVYIELGDFANALRFNNLVIDHGEPKSRMQLYAHARLLNVVIHYELGNTDLMEYLIRSHYRYLRSRNLVYRFEAIVLDLFRALIRVPNTAALYDVFVDVRARLAPLEHDPMEANSFRNFQYLQWLDRKIEILAAALPAKHRRRVAA